MALEEQLRINKQGQAVNEAGVVSTPLQLEQSNLDLSLIQPLETTPFKTPTVISGRTGEKRMDDIMAKTPLPELPEKKKEEEKPITAEDQFIADEAKKEMTPQEVAKLEAREEADRLEADTLATFDEFSTRLDDNKKAQVESIKSQYAQLRQETEKANRRRERLQQTIGVRFGGRFVPEQTEALYQEKVDEGIQRISELNAQENNAIALVQSAFDEKSFVLASKEYDRLVDIREARDKEFERIEKAQLDALRELREQAKEERAQETHLLNLQTKEAQIMNIVSQLGEREREAFGDVLENLEGVRFDELDEETQNQLMQNAFDNGLPLESVINALDIQADELAIAREKGILGIEKERLGLEKTQADIDKARRIDPRIALGVESLKLDIQKKQIDFAKAQRAQSSGAITDEDLDLMSEDAREYVTRAMRLLPTKLKDAEQERKDRMKEFLRDFRNGKPFQQAVDETKGFVITKGDKALANTFREMAAGSGLDLAELAAPLNLGNEVKAMTIVENANLELVDGELKTTAGAKAVLSKANRVLDLLESAPIEDLGAFDGRKFKVKKFFGLSDEDIQKTQTLETAMVNLLNEIRRKSLGTAVTKSEVEFLEPLLTSLLDQPSVIGAKMEELKVGAIQEHNSARSVANLPAITEEQIIDNQKRLQVYKNISSGGGLIKETTEEDDQDVQVVDGITYRLNPEDGLYYPE